MNYTEEQEIFTYKNWSLIQKEDIQALQVKKLKKNMKKKQNSP